MIKYVVLILSVTIIVSISVLSGVTQEVPKYTGRWVESFTCGCGPLCMYKMVMFDGTTIDCDDIKYYGNPPNQLQVCVRKGKVVYKSIWPLDYQCFEWEQVGKNYGVMNGGEKYGDGKELPPPGVYMKKINK